MLVLGLVCTGVAYMLFFAILRGAGASRSILVTYLVPSAALVYARRVPRRARARDGARRASR